MKQNLHWIFKKWGFLKSDSPNILETRIQELEDRVRVLEEENIGQSNALYECWNSLDARIDILAENKTDV